MKLGYKVGPQIHSLNDLDALVPSFVEVWFNIHEADSYTELFDKLRKKRIEVGLHFWGSLPDNTWTTLAYDDPYVLAESKALIKKTIDIASQNEFSYVNIHPGSRAKVFINFPELTFKLASDPIDLDRAESILLEHTLELNDYAKKSGITFTVETVPLRVAMPWNDPNQRHDPVNIYELPVSANIKLAHTGIAVANDFGHTAANILNKTPDAIWNFVLKTTKTLKAATRLIHIGFVVPPYTGTDYHGSLDEPIFETTQAVPNKQQIIELLKLFESRPDVWVLYEPNGNHVHNYLLAKTMLETAKIPFL